MIEIRNMFGQLAELYPEEAIKFEKHNPLFNDNDQFFEDIIIPFRLPLTDPNKIFFSSGHLVEAETKVYKLQVICTISDLNLSAGTVKYFISNDTFEASLLINFGELREKTKSVKLADIFTDDAMSVDYDSAYMKLVCENPKDYPYSFFPVYNDQWFKPATSPVYTKFMVNSWNHASQQFDAELPLSSTSFTPTCPYFKLKYILQKVIKYLGFEITGTWINDPETDTQFIYTRFAFKRHLFGCMAYMPPELTIVDFLKIIRSRYKIKPTFSILTGSMVTDSGNSIIKNDNVIDIRPFVSKINEISIPDFDGYKITLKPDEQDEAWLDPAGIDEKKNYVATNALVVGSGDKEIEVDGSTLKSKTIDDYSMPLAKQPLFYAMTRLGRSDSTWPLRFLRYDGMKPVSGGKYFPQATPMELSYSDAVWYRFLNDGKKVKLSANVPFTLLDKLDGSTKIGFVSKEGNYCEAIIEKISYAIGSSHSHLISVEIECRTVVYNLTTPVSIQPILRAAAANVLHLNFKSYFTFENTGMVEVGFEVYYTSAKDFPDTGGAYAPRTDSGTITISTDKGAGGGQVTPLPTVQFILADGIQLRVRKGKPKYIVIRGLKFDFIEHTDYWYVENFLSSDQYEDGQPIWIVF